ncbi:MAG: HAD family phosphatase [Lachnospiraceae bacterium]|nr:HAD family phosphatase [Lachnospiraceae bacterium]
MNLKYKGVIFDLDGTLVDSMWMWHEIDIEYLGRFGIELPDKLQSEIEGMSFYETAVYFKDRFQIKDSLDKIMADWNQMAWDKYTYEVPLKSGVKEFLLFLKNNGVKTGIATSNSRELTEQILKVHNIEEFLDVIVTGSEVTNGKPAPDIYLEAARKLGVKPSECVAFEDIIPGIQAAKNAGMLVYCVDDAYSKEQWDDKVKLSDLAIYDYNEVLSNEKWFFTDF